MKKLEPELKKNGFLYKLVERTDNCAIYEQFDIDDPNNVYSVAFEVFEVRIAKESSINGRIIEGGERFPGNEDFGSKKCWSFTCISGRDKALNKAKSKYEELKLKVI